MKGFTGEEHLAGNLDSILVVRACGVRVEIISPPVGLAARIASALEVPLLASPRHAGDRLPVARRNLEAPGPIINPGPLESLPMSHVVHTVSSGESLAAIARRYHTTPEAIARSNRLANPNLIRVGERLEIPDSFDPRPPPPGTARLAGSEGPAPAGGVPSAMALDFTIRPRDRSSLRGFESSAEQCGEFVYRYFRESGRGWPDYPTLGQPAEYIRHGQYKPTHPAFKNPGATPPRAGDILAATGPPGSGMFHTALVYKVERDAVWVYQANVPLGNRSADPRDHLMRLPLTRRPDGTWFMPPLPTSRLGYRADMAVTGWIHPTGTSRLPGAAP